MWVLMLFLGLVFGSFGSVILTRFADGITWTKFQNFLFGRSKCPHCLQKLPPKYLFPIISYFIQKKTCSYCGTSISRIYPTLELLSAIIFVLTYLLLQNTGINILIFGLLINRFLVLLLVYDLRTYELHMIVWILLTILVIITNINIFSRNNRNWIGSGMLFGILFLLIYLFAKRYMKIKYKKYEEGFGQGDVYLAITIGMLMPIIFSIHHLTFSSTLIIYVLILFILMSSIFGMLRAGLQFLLKILFGQSLSSLIPTPPTIIPFFPSMIITFRILAWKLPYFISLFFG